MIRFPEIFQQRDFARYIAARALSRVGMQMLSVAIGWQVYITARLTMSVEQSALMVGLVGLVQFAPLFLFALPGGQLADRSDRKVIFTLCLASQTLIALSLLGLQFSPQQSQLPGLFLAAGAFGIMRAFYPAASSSMMPMLIKRDDLPKAIAWSSISMQFGMIAGPAIVGFLFAWSAIAVYASASILLAISTAFGFAIKTDTRAAKSTAGGVEMALEGLRYVWSNKTLFGAVMLDLVVVLLAGATALLPAFANDILHVGPLGLGILRAAPAAGALVVSIYMTRKPIVRRVGFWLLVAVGVFGAATLVFGLARSFPLACVALLITGAADTVSVFVRESLLQHMTPDSMRGRVGSLNMLFISASNELGEFESGLAARFLGPVGAVVTGGLGAILVSVMWGPLFPKLRDADRFEFIEPEPIRERTGSNA